MRADNLARSSSASAALATVNSTCLAPQAASGCFEGEVAALFFPEQGASNVGLILAELASAMQVVLVRSQGSRPHVVTFTPLS